jgi:ornithine carbamoyltransferase
MIKDFVSLAPFSTDDIQEIFALTQWLKETRPLDYKPLAGKTAALIFEKPSLRTHMSFEVGILQLGGQSIFLSDERIGLASRESARDVAEVLSQYNDLIIARTYSHETVEKLAQYASVPVINALTDRLHPCQILADAYTLLEKGLLSRDTRIVFVGDGNNVANSWLELAEKIPLHLVVACPRGYEPDANLLRRAKMAGISKVEVQHDPSEAARGASVLYTDVWVSMGQEEEKLKRQQAFAGFQINQKMLSTADPECLVMHCLPAHRGEEITAEVLEGSQSVVMEEVENRLHVQKGIIAYLLGERAEHILSLDRSSQYALAEDV